MQDNQFQLRIQTVSNGCTDPPDIATAWYTHNAVVPNGANELRVHFEDSTDLPASNCPITVCPEGNTTECGGLLLTDFLNLTEAETSETWCELDLSSTCIQATLNPGEDCFRWDNGTWNEAGTGCTGDSARIVWEQDSETPANWIVRAYVRASGCSGDCTTLEFASSTITIDSGGLTAGVLNQDGVDEIEALLASGVTVTRVDEEACAEEITELVVSTVLDCDATSDDLVTCCQQLDGNAFSFLFRVRDDLTRCECVASGGVVTENPNEDPSCLTEVWCCVDGVVVKYETSVDGGGTGTIESVCAGLGGFPHLSNTDLPGSPCGALCCDSETSEVAWFPECDETNPEADPYAEPGDPCGGCGDEDPTSCGYCDGETPAATLNVSFSGIGWDYGPSSCISCSDSTLSGSGTLTYVGEPTSAFHGGADSGGAGWIETISESGTICGYSYDTRVIDISIRCNSHPCGSFSPANRYAIMEIAYYNGSTFVNAAKLVCDDFSCCTGGAFTVNPWQGCCWRTPTGSAMAS